MKGRLSLAISAALLIAIFAPRPAAAAPVSHILRIDPRAGMNAGKPTLTTVIEVVQFKRLSDVLAPCAGVTGSQTTACWSAQLEKPGALWDPFPFPEQNAHLLVSIAGEDTPTTFVDKTQWGKAQNVANVGTAWLVAVDSSSGMGSRFADARAIAHELIEEMQPNDLMDLMFFDDVQTVQDTKWKTFKQRADLANALNAFKSTTPSHGKDRALFSQIKNMTRDGFGSLGNSDQPDAVPFHQAMVVLSDGAGRGDPESASPSADVFAQYLDSGRFPPENTALPKTPLPVISIWLPTSGSLTENIYRNNDAQFMQSLANPEIGGFFDIVGQGEGTPKAKTIIGLVRARFNAMWLVHWTMSCINASVDQTFNLVFDNVKPAIAPDGTFKDVPIGIDPSQWPLALDMAKTTQAAQSNPLYPGGQFTVYGNFCWAGDKTRAESYFVPAGTAPPKGNAHDIAAAQQAMQQLQAQHMLGTAVAAGDGYVTFNVPDNDQIMNGTGDNAVAHLVVYDNKAHRASALDATSVLTLKVVKKPISVTLIAGVAGLLVVIILLVLVLLRGGGGGKRQGGAPPAAPSGPGYGPPPGGGYGAPPQGYGGPPQSYGGQSYGEPPAGGYGASPLLSPATSPAAPITAAIMGRVPAGGTEAIPANAAPPVTAVSAAGVGGGVVQIQCPACGMNTMATPGQTSFCFSCGQVLPGSASGPPSARLRGTAGEFTVPSGPEVRVGRDPSACSILLGEPRVSGVHATLKLEAGRLLVRDETSNNGTWISNERIVPGTWTPLPSGAT
ncbi:MAG: FHA domain-containing protein, partial [Polyangiaceae bacterium]